MLVEALHLKLGQKREGKEEERGRRDGERREEGREREREGGEERERKRVSERRSHTHTQAS